MKPRLALVLSGGGFRASAFHLGVLRWLAEQGLLPKVDAISTVSGGSIVGAFAVLRWEEMIDAGGDSEALEKHIVEPFLQQVTERNFILEVAKRLPLVPFRKLDRTYTRTKLASELCGEAFFDDKTFAALPVSPHLVVNATNLETIRAWRFTRDGMGDSLSGHAPWGGLPLSLGEGVLASAAFPPVFLPSRIRTTPYEFSGPIYDEPAHPLDPIVALTDGGVYENLGSEVVTKETEIPCDVKLQEADYLIVSDGGYPAQREFSHGKVPLVSELLLLHRVDVIARAQVNALRVRNIVKRFIDPNDSLRGMLVSLGSNTRRILKKKHDTYYGQVGAQHEIPKEITPLIATMRTHLDRFSELECEALMYHAYTMTDAIGWNFPAANPTAPASQEPPNPKWRIAFTGETTETWRQGLEDSDKRRVFWPR